MFLLIDTNGRQTMTVREWPIGLDKGQYGDEAVMFNDRWFAHYHGYEPSRVIGSTQMCLKYYRQDFDADGCSETHLLVREDGKAIFD